MYGTGPPASMFLKYASHLQNIRAMLFCKCTSREGIHPARVTGWLSYAAPSSRPVAYQPRAVLLES